MADVKTKAALGAIAAVILEIQALEKDGFQLSDISAFMTKYQTDPVFAGKIKAGWSAAALVIPEIKAMNWLDMLDLYAYIKGLLKTP